MNIISISEQLEGCITKTACQTEKKWLILFASPEGWRTLVTRLSNYLVKIGVWTPHKQYLGPQGFPNAHLPQPKVWLDDFGRRLVAIYTGYTPTYNHRRGYHSTWFFYIMSLVTMEKPRVCHCNLPQPRKRKTLYYFPLNPGCIQKMILISWFTK